MRATTKKKAGVKTKSKPKTVDDYLARLSSDKRATLNKLRKAPRWTG